MPPELGDVGLGRRRGIVRREPQHEQPAERALGDAVARPRGSRRRSAAGTRPARGSPRARPRAITASSVARSSATGFSQKAGRPACGGEPRGAARGRASAWRSRARRRRRRRAHPASRQPRRRASRRPAAARASSASHSVSARTPGRLASVLAWNAPIRPTPISPTWRGSRSGCGETGSRVSGYSKRLQMPPSRPAQAVDRDGPVDSRSTRLGGNRWCSFPGRRPRIRSSRSSVACWAISNAGWWIVVSGGDV